MTRRWRASNRSSEPATIRSGYALRTIEPEHTPLEHEISRLVRVIAAVSLGAAAVVVIVFGLTRGHWLQGLLAGIGTAMAMLPRRSNWRVRAPKSST